MISRKILINIHLVLAALFMPLMLMMPFTGALYLLGYQGDQTKTEIFRINEPVPEDEAAQETFFRRHLEGKGMNSDFEYIRSTKTDFIMRPTTRTHFMAAKANDNELIVYKIEPNLLKRMIELHKGHGPRMMRWFETAFGLALILTTLSGLWLAWTVKPYRNTTLISFAVGVALILVCLI